MAPWRNSEWVRRLVVFDLRWRSYPSASPAAPSNVSKATANAFNSHRRSRRAGVLTRIDAMPMPKGKILCVAESALDSPAFAVQTLEVVGGCLGAAGGQAPSLLHVLVAHAQHGADLITVSRHLGAAQHLRASTGSDPSGGGARLAVPRGDDDVSAEAD